MDSLNMKIYEDGTRTIVVFNNLKTDIKAALSDIIGTIAGGSNGAAEKINNVIPMQEEDEPMPVIPDEYMASDTTYAARNEYGAPLQEDFVYPDTLPFHDEEPTVNECMNAPVPETVPAFDPVAAIKQNGFDGFLEVYTYFNQNCRTMPLEEQQKFQSLISTYLQRMGKSDPENLKDDTLARSVLFLYQTYYADKLPMCLNTIGLDSLENLVSAGRPYLVAAYKICFGIV